MTSYNNIKHVERMRQAFIFEDVSSDGIGMTDVDGLIEYKDRAYVFLEMKYREKDVPIGQKLALERLVKDSEKAGKLAIAIVAEHEVYDCNEPVFVKNCVVREVYYSKEKVWRPPKHIVTVQEMVDAFIRTVKK